MTDVSSSDAPPASGAVQNLPIVVHAQYIRDLSFENPNAPNALRAGQDGPRMDINIGLDLRKIQDDKLTNLYEVILKVTAKAQRKEYTVYIAEVEYGLTVSLQNVQEAQHHPILLVEVPKLGFPFVRKILADLTQDGGYPPLLLGPVDFYSMYLNQFGKKEQPAA